MTALAAIALPPEAQVQAPVAAVAAWLVAPGALMVLGRCHDALPAQGTAQFERRQADRGQYRCLAWTVQQGSPDAAGTAFCAAVRLPDTTPVQPGRLLALLGGGEPAALHLPDRFLAATEFAEAAARLAGTAGGVLARFLADTFPAAVLQAAPQAGQMLAAYAGRIAVQDGAIELVGDIAHAAGGAGCAFLQGWGFPVDGGAEILLVGMQLGRFAVQAAQFARPDIIAPASGLLLVLPGEAIPALDHMEQAFLLSGTRVHRLTLFQRRRLTPEDSVGHLRAMLPLLRCPPEAADCLRAALRPRYEGRDTVASLPTASGSGPVRAAIDLAVAGPGGIYVTGWLLDPGRQVASVHLCGAPGVSARIDDSWSRVLRPDVHDSFAASLPPHADAAHGFTVFVATPSPEPAGLHLELALLDGSRAFLPVPATASDHAGCERRLLDSVDLYKPTGLAIVERHLAPAMHAFAARRPVPVPAPGNTPAEVEAETVIVLPLTDDAVLPRACLSQFLHDPLRPSEALLLVCGPNWDDAAVLRLRRLLAFTGLRASVLCCSATTECAALDAAAAASRSAHLLLLHPDGFGARPGWRALLAEAAAAQPGACACPTLLHEDDSIRFAGVGAFRILPHAPFAAPERDLAGLPAASAKGPPRPTRLGSLLCCLLPRATLSAIGGACQGGFSRAGREAALFERLLDARHACLLVPQAAVYAPDRLREAHADGSAARVARLVDGWMLRRRLAEAGECP